MAEAVGTTAADASTAQMTAASGHGLIGIHERVRLYGGEMTTATTNGGGFSLTACLPLAGYRS